MARTPKSIHRRVVRAQFFIRQLKQNCEPFADDLTAVIEALDLTDVTLVGHSTGGGKVAGSIGRHCTKRVAAAVLIAAVPPILEKSAIYPEGIPIEVFDELRSSLAKDHSQFYKYFAAMF